MGALYIARLNWKRWLSVGNSQFFVSVALFLEANLQFSFFKERSSKLEISLAVDILESDLG